MSSRRRQWAGLRRAVAGLALMGVCGAAAAAPRVGQAAPVVEGKDLHGSRRSALEGDGGQKVLLVVMTEQGAEDATREWLSTAATRVPPTTAWKNIISLDLPFFVSEGKARAKARAQVPPEYWDEVLLDVRRSMAKRLGLPKSDQPFVFALSPDGRVLASAHGSDPHGPAALRIWQALCS